MSEEKAVLTIHYIDGAEQKFEFTRHPDRTANVAGQLHEALKENYLLIALEDRVLIIMLHQVRMAEISPPPQKLPANAVRNARLL